MHASTRTILLLDLAIALLVTIAFESIDSYPIIAAGSVVIVAVLIPIGILRCRTQRKHIGELPVGQKIILVASFLALAVAWVFAILLGVGAFQFLILPDSYMTIL